MDTYKKVKELIDSLPIKEHNILLDQILQDQELKGSILAEASDDVIAKRHKKPCPHCHSANVQKRGRQSGTQMYRCKNCSKWYSETTGTALEGIKLKEKWQSYLRCMEKGMPIKKIAKELGISIQTSFDWRHKILSSLAQFEPELLADEVECDEMELVLN